VSCSLDRSLYLPLAPCTITASLARIYLAAVGYKLLKCLDVFIIDILGRAAAKTALCLLADVREILLLLIVLPFILPFIHLLIILSYSTHFYLLALSKTSLLLLIKFKLIYYPNHFYAN
jgi:hypothetical protein